MDEATVLRILDEPGVTEDGQVMGDVDWRRLEHFGDFGDVAGTVAQEADDPQPLGSRQGSKQLGAALGLQRIRRQWQGVVDHLEPSLVRE